MADWYASTAAYALIAAFVPSGTYVVGDIVKPTVPAAKACWAFRCTTAGVAGTEPTWPTGDNAPIATGAATFTNVTGQSTYAWAAAAGDMPTLLGAVGAQRFFGGDRMFVSHDHNETQATGTTYGAGGASTISPFASGQILSVNRAGSVPPVAADLLPGAIARVSAGAPGISLTFTAGFNVYHYGITYINTSPWVAEFIFDFHKTHYFERCQIWINNSSGLRIQNGGSTTVVLDNSSLRFSSAGQYVQFPYDMLFTWLNTPIPLGGGSIPTQLFNSTTGTFILRGLDLSLLTTALVKSGEIVNPAGPRFLLDSCRIAPGVIRLSNGAGGNLAVGTRDLVELVNCFDGTSFISERWMSQGAVTTEFAVTLTNGARDNVGAFSHKMVSNANADRIAEPLTGFWMDLNNIAIGTPLTAVVEIISSVTLNDNDIWLLLEYEGTVGSSIASFVKSQPITLTGATPVLSSTAAWNSMPASPIRQQLRVTFTPQVAGRLRAQVCLGRPSTTVWYNPQVLVSS